MHMKKQIASVLVAAAMAVAFVGCSSMKKARSSDSETETSSTKTESSSDSDSSRTAADSSSSDTSSSSTSASASSGSSSSSASSSTASGTGSVAIANPWSDFSTQEDAEDAAGISLDIPSVLPFGYTRQVNRAIPNDTLEIIYYNDVADDEVRLRKAKLPLADGTSDSADISGDFNKYLITKNMAAEDKRVNLRGEVNNYHVATWTDGDYAYAVTSKNGIPEEEMLSFVSQLY